MIKGVHTELY